MPTAADEARAILSDPRAVPAAERFDAQAEMERKHRPTAASDLIPKEALSPIIKAVQTGAVGDALAKASGSRAATAGGLSLVPKNSRPEGMRGVRVDPEKTMMAGDEYVEKPGAIDFEGLRAMVNGTPILAAVIGTRIRQMMRFCQPSEDGGPGFEIRHRDKEHKATRAEKEKMRLLERFISNGGWEWTPRKRKQLHRDTFPVFMSKLLRDSLTFDASPFETEMRRDGRGIDGLYALDGSSVRLCSDEGHRGDDEVFALQVVSGRVRTLYRYDQLCYEVRNPRTDLNLAGYGFGETEILVRTVTALLQAHSYNQDFFDKNSIPKGILQVFGDYAQEEGDAFRRQWQQMVSGNAAHWSLPLLMGQSRDTGAIYTPFNTAASEMAFAKWITFLTSVVCAVFNIDPGEIGFESFAASGKSTLSGNDTEQKLSASRDKGFVPLASHFEGVLTDFVVADFDPDLVFRYAGMEEEDKDRKWEAAKIVSTIDELRAGEGMQPHKDKRIGALPAFPQLIGPAMQLMHPQAAEGGDFGGQAPEQQEPGDDFGGEAPEAREATDFGGEAPERKDPTDFGGEAPQPKEPTDFGAEAPAPRKPGNEFGKTLTWRFGKN